MNLDSLKNSNVNELITEITNNTKLKDLFEQYPDLKDYMISKSDKFKLLDSPVFSMMIGSVTAEKISEKTGFSIETLADGFKKFLEQRK